MSTKTSKNLIYYNGIDSTTVFCEPLTVTLDGLEICDNYKAISVETLALRWQKARERDRELGTRAVIL